MQREALQKSTEDTHHKIKVLNEHVDHQKTKKMFKDRFFMVLAELQEQDMEINKLKDGVKQLTRILSL